MDRITEMISYIMRREAKLFVFLLLNELNKHIEAHVEKKGAEAVSLKDTPTNRNSRAVKSSVIMEVLKFS